MMIMRQKLFAAGRIAVWAANTKKSAGRHRRSQRISRWAKVVRGRLVSVADRVLREHVLEGPRRRRLDGTDGWQVDAAAVIINAAGDLLQFTVAQRAHVIALEI